MCDCVGQIGEKKKDETKLDVVIIQLNAILLHKRVGEGGGVTLSPAEQPLFQLFSVQSFMTTVR
jgi:hypothetical protein